MATVELTTGNFEQLTHAEGIALIDFWAEWCGPCRAFAPVFDAASDRHPDILFGKVDTEAEQQLAGVAGITSIPTIMAFREGILVFAQPGALPANVFEDVVTQVKALDMDEVRQKLNDASRANAAENGGGGCGGCGDCGCGK